MMGNNFFSDDQFGFLPGRSTCTQLLATLNDLTSAANEKQRTDMVLSDLSKAFDTVVHPKLHQKLECYGIGGLLLAWIDAFLSDRTQRVVVGDSISDSADVTSGVPQGSVLGPPLFLVFINDAPACTEAPTKAKVFADDGKFYLERGDADNLPLVRTLGNYTEYTDKSQLSLATEKCEVLSTGNLRLPPCEYILAGHKLAEVTRIKDVGIIITSDLKFGQHISAISAIAHRSVSNIAKLFISRDPSVLVQAYKAYTQPIKWSLVLQSRIPT